MKSTMKSTGDRRLQILPFMYQSLIICFIVLGLVFIGGTIYGVFFHSTPSSSTQKEKLRDGISGEGQTFTGIGPIRVSTTDPQPGMVMLFVLFIYYPDDKAFSEELVLRVRDIREIIVNYVGSLSIIDLRNMGEDKLKMELLRRFNAILRLGQIEMLYFSDFMIVE